MTHKIKKMKDEDMEAMRKVLKRTISRNYKPQPEWEDKHPILATLIVLVLLLLNPVSLFIIGGFILLIILLG